MPKNIVIPIQVNKESIAMCEFPAEDVLNAKDKEGKTALMHAVLAGRKEVVQQLIESNANVNARTNAEESALSYALKTGRAEIIALLKANGARE